MRTFENGKVTLEATACIVLLAIGAGLCGLGASQVFATGVQENKHCVPAYTFSRNGHCYVNAADDCVPDHRFDIGGTSVACESGWDTVGSAVCDDGYEWCEVLTDAEEFLLYYITRTCIGVTENGELVECYCEEIMTDTKMETVDQCWYG